MSASQRLELSDGRPFYRHEHSYVSLLKIEGSTVYKVGQADVCGLAEGVAFSRTVAFFEFVWRTKTVRNFPE